MKRILPIITLVLLVSACERPQQPAAQSPAPKAAALTPAQQSAAKAKALIDQGMEYFAKEDIVNALKSFDEAIMADPNNGENFLVLGQIYLRLRNYDKAVDTFNAGTRVDPQSAEMFYFLAASNAIRFHLSSGEQAQEYKQEGIAAAQRAVEIFIEEKNEVGLKTSLALLKSLQEDGDFGKTPPQVSE